jgi:hypothetical protein
VSAFDVAPDWDNMPLDELLKKACNYSWYDNVGSETDVPYRLVAEIRRLRKRVKVLEKRCGRLKGRYSRRARLRHAGRRGDVLVGTSSRRSRACAPCSPIDVMADTPTDGGQEPC